MKGRDLFMVLCDNLECVNETDDKLRSVAEIICSLKQNLDFERIYFEPINDTQVACYIRHSDTNRTIQIL